MSSYPIKSASHTSVVETTFLLCKPGAQHLHRNLLQLVADANFRVQAKSFTMTPAIADVIARTFPSVKESERLAAAKASTAACSSSPHHASEMSTTSAGTQSSQTSGMLASAGTATCATTLLEAHVQHLCSGGPCLAMVLSAANAVNRLLAMVGPEDPSDARRVAPTSLRAMHGGDDVVHNAIHACTNLQDAGLCIRAVFGYDTPSLVGVTRSTAAVVAAAAAAGARGDETMSTSTAAGDDGGTGGDAADGLLAVPRPDASSLQLPIAGVHPVTLAELLQRPAEQLRLLGGHRLAISPPTPSCDRPSPASSLVQPQVPLEGEGAAGPRAASQQPAGHTGYAGDSTTTSTMAATERSRQQLAEAWEALDRQRELLRAKEVDIFLREATGQFPPTGTGRPT